MKRKFAAFDIDGTLYRNSLFMDLIAGLHAEGLMNDAACEEYLNKKQQWAERAHDNAYPEFVGTSLNHIDTYFADIRTRDVDRIAREAVEAHYKKTYVYTTTLLKELQASGYVTLAISASNEELVAPFAQKYGFDDYSCSVWHRSDDGTTFTGEFDEGGSDKAAIVKKLVKKHGLSTEKSIAIGDTKSDVSMLDSVETAIAFNPDEALLDHAKKHGWNIVVERKSVAYKMEFKDGTYVLA